MEWPACPPPEGGGGVSVLEFKKNIIIIYD